MRHRIILCSFILCLAASCVLLIIWPISYKRSPHPYLTRRVDISYTRKLDTTPIIRPIGLSIRATEGRVLITYLSGLRVISPSKYGKSHKWNFGGVRFNFMYLGNGIMWSFDTPFIYPVVLTTTFSVVLIFLWWRQRWRQHSQRLCPFCNYDLRTSTDRCPECGTSVKPSHNQTIKLAGQAAANPNSIVLR